jgi:hypothetical protein
MNKMSKNYPPVPQVENPNQPDQAKRTSQIGDWILLVAVTLAFGSSVLTIPEVSCKLGFKSACPSENPAKVQ